MKTTMATLESIEFEADMGVISGSRIFMKALAASEPVQALIAALNGDADAQQMVFDRFLHVLYLQQTLGYAHPHDAGLAAYLYALHQTASEHAATAAAHALRVPEAWWTGRVAQALMQPDAALTPQQA
jgi:hypothetical protein